MQLQPSLYLLVGTVVAACGSAVDDPSPPRPVAAASAIEGGGLSPDLNWKVERKRLAMLGLSYESGRARVVPSEAASLLAKAGDPIDAKLLPQLQREGQVALAENRALDGIALFTKAVLLEPGVADHYVPLGRALQAFNLESQAIAAWETGHELDPDHVQLTFHVADMAYRQGDRDRACALYQRTLDLDPEHAATWGRLARISYYDESDDEAWREIHRAEELGEAIPALMRARLAARSPEPQR